MSNAANKQAALARQAELVVQEMPDEVLVYDLRNHEAHCLNQTAALVWNHCDGQRATAEIAALMTEELDKPVSEDVVWLALKQLSKAGLLQEPVTIPQEVERVSRRQVMRRIGIAAMVPLVMSVVVPTAMAGASVPPVCIPCANFGGVGNRQNTCPPECTGVPGCCFKNNSCSGIGNLLATGIDCPTCFASFSSPTPNDTSLGWRGDTGTGCT